MLSEVADLLEKLQAERQDLLNILRGFSEEKAQEHPHGEWSAKQQVAHLVQGEPEWLGWALEIYTTPGATVGQPQEVEQPFLKFVQDADSKPLLWWIEQLQQVRAQTLQHLEQMDTASAEAMQRKGTHRTWGEMNVLQFLRGIYRHDRMHRDQLLDREQGFTPRRAP